MDFRQYLGKLIVSWLWYNPAYEERFGNTNLVCYLYPRFLINNGFEKINAEEDFPENGRMEIFIQGGQNARDIFEKFGPLVSVRLNREVAPNYKGHNRYRLNYNPQSAGFSDLTMERLSPKKFYQILETETSFDAFRQSGFLDNVEEAPFIDYVLIQNGGFLYGPFSYRYAEGRLFLKGIREFQYQAGKYAWGDCVQSLIEVKNQSGDSAALLLPADVIPPPDASENAYDCVSDDQLILGLANALKAGERHTREEIEELLKAAEGLTENHTDMPLTDERKARLQTLSKDVAAWNELADSVLSENLSDEALLDKLSELAVERHFERIKDKLTEQADVQEYLGELRQREAELQGSIDRLQRRRQALQQELEDLSDRISGPESAETVAQIDAAVQERRLALDEYERKINDARALYDYERSQKNKLDASLGALIRRYQDEAGQITRLFDRKILDGLLSEPSGETPAQGAQARPFQPSPFHPSLLQAPMSRDEILSRVSDYLRNQAGRMVSHNDVANYLICLSQGFLTAFAGRSGVGKTALCELLAKALGLATGDAQNRYVEIPVERGWTSHRDFIGTFVPETNALRVNNTEVWEALERLDRERENIPYAPFLMTLDEANLSPMEYYFSAFLRNSDLNASGKRVISIGGGKSWSIPPHLRFLATVNSDNVTEKLSPRFLDRAWVISLEPCAIAENAQDNPENVGKMIAYPSLRDAFRPTSPEGTDRILWERWNVLREVFLRRGFPVTPRSARMVRDYCAVACGCMATDTPETRFAPLDYAVSQKVLPLIGGQGEMGRDLIYDLRRECAGMNMPLCLRQLDRLQRIADSNRGGYPFFN